MWLCAVHVLVFFRLVAMVVVLVLLVVYQNMLPALCLGLWPMECVGVLGVVFRVFRGVMLYMVPPLRGFPSCGTPETSDTSPRGRSTAAS